MPSHVRFVPLRFSDSGSHVRDSTHAKSEKGNLAVPLEDPSFSLRSPTRLVYWRAGSHSFRRLVVTDGNISVHPAGVGGWNSVSGSE